MSVWTLINKVIVIVHGERHPTDQEFDRLIQDLHTWADDCTGILVVAGQMAPNATQRQKLTDDALMLSERVAVLTDSAAARGSITAMHWLGKAAIRGFAPADVRAALDYLEVPIAARPAIVGVAAKLKAETLAVRVDELRAANPALSGTRLDEYILRETPVALRESLHKRARPNGIGA
jgi:hypothetical protein